MSASTTATATGELEGARDALARGDAENFLRHSDGAVRSIVGDGDAFSDRMARNLLYATWIGLVGDCMAEAERAEFEGRSPQVEWPTLDDLRAAASERSDRLIQRLETWSAQISEFGRHPRHSDRAQAAFLKVLLLEPEVAVPGAQEVVARAFKGRKQKG